jgi:hypothetical protein
MSIAQQILDLGGEEMDKHLREKRGKDMVQSAYRTHLWQSFHLRPPLAGCGPFTPTNDNPYWPAAASEARRFDFEVGQWQQAWMECWKREAGYR